MPCEQLQPTCVAQSGLKQTICVYDPLTGAEIKAIHTYDITAQCSTINETFTRLDGSALPAGYQLRACVQEVAVVRQTVTAVIGTVTVTGVSTAANQATGNTSLASIDGKLGTLGQKTMAGSAPVVIASDQSAIPVQAGGYGATPSASFSRPADTNVYAIGDLVANSVTAGSVTRLNFTAARVAAGSGIIRRVTMTSGSTSLTNASYRLHLWTADPGAPSVGDNGVYVVQTMVGYLGYVDVTMSIVTADGSWGEGIPSFDKEFKLASGTTVYGQVEVRAARTPASGTTHTVSLDVIQD